MVLFMPEIPLPPQQHKGELRVEINEEISISPIC